MIIFSFGLLFFSLASARRAGNLVPNFQTKQLDSGPKLPDPYLLVSISVPSQCTLDHSAKKRSNVRIFHREMANEMLEVVDILTREYIRKLVTSA